MTVYVGGIRSRLIRDSLINMIVKALEDLGWLDEGREHAPINVIATSVETDDEVPYNTLAFADDDLTSTEEELGSQFAEHRWSWFIDFFAEDNSVGVHLIQDVKSILEGRIPSIGRPSPVLDVYDYTLDVPERIFTCDIENVRTHRAHGFPRPHQRYWHSCSLDLVDYYGDENY